MKRDAKGLSIEDRVYEEHAKNADTGKYISSRFWCNIFSDFGLNSCIEIPKPGPEAQDVASGELLDAMHAAHNDNPVKANSAPLMNIFDHCDGLGEKTTYGLLKSLIPCPTLTVNLAANLQLSFLNMWDRTR